MPNEWVSLEVRATCYKNRDTVDELGNPRTIVHHIDFNHNNNDPDNLIFLSVYEHNKVHANDRKGDYWDRVSKTMSEVKKGVGNAMYGRHHSEETKCKIRKSNVGKTRSDETKLKQSLRRKGKHWFTNGVTNKFDYECPEGFVNGRFVK